MVEPGGCSPKRLGPSPAGRRSRIVDLEGASNAPAKPSGLNRLRWRCLRRALPVAATRARSIKYYAEIGWPGSTGCVEIMEIVSIALARLTALIQFQEWDPFGKTLTLEALAKLGGRYSFAKGPTKLADIDFQKGIELLEGSFGEVRIDKIAIYLNGIVIDTRSSTEDAETILNDILALAHEAFGAKIKPARHSFASHIIFRSPMRLSSLNPVLPTIADVLTERSSADLKHPFIFEPTSVLFNIDSSQAKIAPQVFTIERRAEIPFAENTYFSGAPLRTNEHIEVLKTFESAILAQ